VTIMEKLQGVDVLTCLSQRHEYTENMVAHIITQAIIFFSTAQRYLNVTTPCGPRYWMACSTFTGEESVT